MHLIFFTYIFRLEGYFYKDEYIGEKPNEKIQKRMAKKKNKRDTVDFSITEQTDLRYCFSEVYRVYFHFNSFL